MDPRPPTSSSSVFSRRPSFFGGKSRHKPSRSHVPPSLVLPADDIPEAHTSPPYHPHPHSPYNPPPGQYSQPTTPPPPTARTRHSISSTVGDLGLQLRRSRSTSLRSAASHKRHPSTSTMHSVSLSLSPDNKVPPAAPLAASRPALSIATFARNKAKSSDNVKSDVTHLQHDKTTPSVLDKPKTPFAMAVPLRHAPAQKDTQRQPSGGLAPAAPLPGANPNIVFQHIHELASKRISTLDYLRKA